MADVILTEEEAKTLKITFGFIIFKKLGQTKWVLENKKDEESVKAKKEQMENSVKNYESILKKIGWEDRVTKKNPSIFSFKKSRPFKAN